VISRTDNRIERLSLVSKLVAEISIARSSPAFVRQVSASVQASPAAMRSSKNAARAAGCSGANSSEGPVSRIVARE